MTLATDRTAFWEAQEMAPEETGTASTLTADTGLAGSSAAVATAPNTGVDFWADKEVVEEEPAQDDAEQRRQKVFWAEQDAGRPLSMDERAKLYQDDLAERGNTKAAVDISRQRAGVDNAARDVETAEAKETAFRAPYLVLRGVENGLTLGLSKPIFAAVERARGGRVEAESTGEALAAGAGELLGGVFTGMGLAKGMGNLTGRFGMVGARQVLATRLLASGVQSALSSAGDVVAGDISGKTALANIAQSVGASVVGMVPETFIRAGNVKGRALNWVGQVVTDVMYDAFTDGVLRDRIKDQGFQNWLITQELPNLVMTVAFATKDNVLDTDFEGNRAAIAKEISDGFKRRVLRQTLPKDIFRPTEYRGVATEPHADRIVRGPVPQGTAPREAATGDALRARMDDAGLEPELRRLSGELQEAEGRAATGGAGLIQVKDDRGQPLGWKSQGRAYPEGMDRDTRTAVDKFLAGGKLTDKQTDAVERALNYVADEVSRAAGFDIEAEEPVPQMALKVGDELTIRGEKYRVTGEDEDGGIRLQDGVERRALPGETLMADKGSVKDGDGKPVDVERRAAGGEEGGEGSGVRVQGEADEEARREFWRDQEAAPAEDQPPALVRTMEDGTRVERIAPSTGSGQGRLVLVYADGERIELDPELPDHQSLMRSLNPDLRTADVAEAAQAAADRLPGATGRVVRDESEIPENVRAKLQSVQGEDGVTRGFAVLDEAGKPTGEYYILARNIGSPEEAERVVVHEAVGHVGVRAVLGSRTDAVLDGVYAGKIGGRQRALEEIARRYKLDLGTEAGRREAAEELIAHVAEQRTTDPGTWKRFVAAFRDVMRRAGFKVEFSDADIAALIGQARRRVGKATPLNSEGDDIRRSAGTQRTNLASQQLENIRRANGTAIDPNKNLMDQMKRLKERWGRPELSQIATDAGARRIVAEVDQMRKEAGNPEAQSHLEWNQKADNRIRENGWAREWARMKAGRLDMKHGEDVKLAMKLIDRYGTAAAAGGDREQIAAVAATVWEYRQQRTETARALAAGADPLETPTARAQRWITEALFEPPNTIARQLEGMTFDQRKAELAKHADRVGEALDALKKIGVDITNIDEATLADRAKMGEILRTIQIKNATRGDVLFEYWRNAILSAPPTHLANIVGNTANSTWEYTAQRWAEAAVNLVARQPGGATFGELIPVYRSLWRAVPAAGRAALTAFSTEQPIMDGTKFEKTGIAIPGTAGRVIRTPQRALLAADEFAKALIIEAEGAAQAYRQAKAEGLKGDAFQERFEALKEDPDGALHAEALVEARRLTFQAPPGAVSRMLLNARRNHPLIGYMFPFVTTPANVFKTGLKKTPLGLLRMAYKGGQGDYAGLKGRQDLLKDSAEQVLVLAAVGALWSITADDDDGLPRITGSAPSEGSAARLMWERNNIQPQSVRMGGKWHSYARVEPVSTSMTLLIDSINAVRNSEGADVEQRTARVTNSLKSMVRDKTFLQTMGDIVRAFEAQDSTLGRGADLVQNFVASWVPNGIRTIARASDPYIRDYRTPKQEGETVTSKAQTFAQRTAQKMLPVPSLAPSPKRDWTGRPISKDTGMGYATDFLYRAIAPVQARVVNIDNINRMLFNYNRRATKNGWEQWWPTVPDNSMTLPGIPMTTARNARMTPDEYERFQEMRGKLFAVASANQKWQFDAPQLKDIRAVQHLLSKSTDIARMRIIQERKLGDKSRKANDALVTLQMQSAGIDDSQFREQK